VTLLNLATEVATAPSPFPPPTLLPYIKLFALAVSCCWKTLAGKKNLSAAAGEFGVGYKNPAPSGISNLSLLDKHTTHGR
jgi:hypothetical protein